MRWRGAFDRNLFLCGNIMYYSVLNRWNHVSSRLWTSSQRGVVSQAIIEKVKSITGDGYVTTNEDVLTSHGKDEGPYNPLPPDLVVFAQSESHVQQIVSLCNETKTPVIPFGSGTGLEGGVGAVNGGICIDVSQMQQILSVNIEDFDCRVQTGVNWRQLNEHLRDTGMWFPVDPGASASLGGMASTGASGTNAVRYGTMKQNVLNLRVCLPNGTIINTSGEKTRTRKTSAGYNLTELFVGSEGTLGIVTELTLRLKAAPNSISCAVCSFPSVESAINSAIEILQNDIPVGRIEFLDALSIQASKKYSQLDMEEKPALFLEFHGPNDAHVEREMESVKDITREHGCTGLRTAVDQEARTKLWKARHELYYAILNLKPRMKGVATDVCVPISQLTKMISGATDLFVKHHINCPINGHVGDGNFHSILFFDPKDETDLERIKKISYELGRLAISLDGTCTGEHGIGRGKMNLLKDQFGHDSVAAMMTLKQTLDPNNIMNPGKLF